MIEADRIWVARVRSDLLASLEHPVQFCLKRTKVFESACDLDPFRLEQRHRVLTRGFTLTPDRQDAADLGQREPGVLRRLHKSGA